MDRLHEILHKKKEFLQDGETLLYVKDGSMHCLYTEDDSLVEVKGDKNDDLYKFLNWIYDENKY